MKQAPNCALSCIQILLLSAFFIFSSGNAVGQTELQIDKYEKLIKKKGLLGLKSKLHHFEIKPEYDNLLLTKEFVLAMKGSRADLYWRSNLTLYLGDILPTDTSFIYSFHQKLFPNYFSKLLHLNGKWGWHPPRSSTPVKPEYDSIGTLSSRWYIVYKNGKGAISDIDGKIFSPFLEYGYSNIVSSGFNGYLSMVTRKDASGVEWRGAYLNADTTSFIPVQYNQIVIEDFPTSLTLNQKTYRGWVAARYASGKTDYYDMISLKPFSTNEVETIFAIRDNRKADHANLKKQMALYRVFRNEKGLLGVLSPTGELIVPPGLLSLRFQHSILSKGMMWNASSDTHGLQLIEDFTRKTSSISSDTAYIFPDAQNQEETASFELKAAFSKNIFEEFLVRLDEVPAGGYTKIVKFNRCRLCTNGKVAAHYIRETETYQIAPAQTTTRTEKLVSKDLDKNGKFPTRTVTTTTPARTGTRTNNVYVPEQICSACDGKGNIAEVIEWNEKLQIFEKKVFGASSRPK